MMSVQGMATQKPMMNFVLWLSPPLFLAASPPAPMPLPAVPAADARPNKEEICRRSRVS